MRDSTPPEGQGPSSEAVTRVTVLLSETLHDTLAALRAAGNAGASYDAVGRRVGVARQNVNEWCQAGYERLPKLVHLGLMGPTIGPAVLRAFAAKLEERAGQKDLRDAVLGMQEAVGTVARRAREALADDEITDAEERALEASLLASEAEIAVTRAAIAAHREAHRARRQR